MAAPVALTSAAVVLAVAGFAALAVVAVPIGWDRGRHPVVLRSTTVLTAVLTVLLAIGVFVNSQAGFFPTLASVVGQGSGPLPVGAAGVVADLSRRPYDLSAAAALHRPGQGVVVRVELGGGLSGISRPGAVYLPDAYFASTTTQFPVIEVLSGSPGNPAQMLSQLHLAAVADEAIAAGRMAPTVLVVPDT
ncbi:MAG: esterase, partial [Frankiales bacterium]|nr:esterase [Frankiales bacterium]